MSDKPTSKDARTILAENGADSIEHSANSAHVIPFAQPQPPATPTPFAWRIAAAADVWTNDELAIDRLSDPPLVDGLLREGEVATVVGASKTAKTWFSLALAVAVAEGNPFLDRPTHRKKTLYLDYELKPGTFAKRLAMLSPGKPDNLHFQCLRGHHPLPGIGDISELIKREGFGLVIVDSLYRTGWLSEENNNDSTGRELAALQALTSATGASIVLVDHTAKGGGNERSAVDAARGASAKGGFFDALLVLRPTDKGPDDGGSYAILDPVLRDWPRVDSLPLVGFHWGRTTCRVTQAGEMAKNEAENDAMLVMESLGDADRGKGISAIVTDCPGTSEKRIRQTLAALAKAGRILEFPDPKHSQRKLYRLPDIADKQTVANRSQP